MLKQTRAPEIAEELGMKFSVQDAGVDPRRTAVSTNVHDGLFWVIPGACPHAVQVQTHQASLRLWLHRHGTIEEKGCRVIEITITSRVGNLIFDTRYWQSTTNTWPPSAHPTIPRSKPPTINANWPACQHIVTRLTTICPHERSMPPFDDQRWPHDMNSPS
jgi:hypothetical protein